MNLVTPKAAANHELLFNKPTSAQQSVTKFIPIIAIILVSLYVAAKSLFTYTISGHDSALS